MALSSSKYMTATIETNESFLWYGSSHIISGLKRRLGSIIDIILVDRPLFSSRFVVTYKPKTLLSKDEWLSAFDAAFQDMGYTSAKTIGIVGGKKSDQPGGLKGAALDTSEIAGEIVGNIMKPLIPILIIGLGLYFLPTIMRGVKKKNV